MGDLSVAVRNAKLDAIETEIGPNAVIEIREGAKPANCAAARTGTILSTVNLGVDWMDDAANGQKSKSVPAWEDLSADASGTAGYFSLYESTVSTCHYQGTCTLSGGGGDMILNTLDFVAGQPFSIDSFQWTEGNAGS